MVDIDEIFINNHCPFGIDTQQAINIADEFGEDENWVINLILNYPIIPIDPIYCVYDAVLQHARKKIKRLTGFDIAESGIVITCKDRYYCEQNDLQELKDAILPKKDSLNTKTNWFIDQLGIEF